MSSLYRIGPASLVYFLLGSLCISASAQTGNSAVNAPADNQTNWQADKPAGPQKADDQGRTRLPMEVRKSVSFREIGPAISGGRVTAVAGVAGDPKIYFVGSADGGVFRSNDGGMTWKALFQHQDVASIGALAVDPQNPGVVWAGTGEANVRNDISFGDGIYKSTDGGAHWSHTGLEQTFQISKIAIDPHDSNTVLVAAMGNPWADGADRGVYRTTDGGTHWNRVLYVGPGVGIADMAMDPKNPNVVFAAAYPFRRTPWGYSDGGAQAGIYKSADGGVSWHRLSGPGLPTGPVGRIGLAIAPSAPDVVYAVIGSNDGVLWRSDDAGDHWTLVSKSQEVDARPFYFSHLVVDPKNPDHVFALSNELMESMDGGKHFSPIAKQVHVDHHAMWIDPDGSGRILDGNDGGAVLSEDNGRHWTLLDNMAIGQLYHVATGPGPRYLVCGGLQDNSSWCGTSRSKNSAGVLDRAWFTLNGGDGIFAIPAPDDENLIYDSTQNGVFMVFNRAEEQVHDIEPYPRDFVGDGVAEQKYRFAWNAGFAVSPQDPKVLYAGGNVVFKSEDRGQTWKAISPDLTLNEKAKQGSSGGPVMKDNSGAEVYDAILAIAPSATDPKVLWVGTDDGQVQLTRDGGTQWTNVTAHLPGLEPWGRIESIDLPPGAPGTALIAVDRHFSADFKPYLFKTTDYGASWESITGNLPQGVYAHVVKSDLHNPRMYYAGLENGLYVSWDAGAHWYLFGLGLPSAAVYDLTLNAKPNDLVVGTHGRSIWVLDDLTPFEQFTPKIAEAKVHLFAPADALRFSPWSQVEFLGDSAFKGKNPPYGAEMSYFLSAAIKEPGKLVITDAEGHVVRTLEGTHPLDVGETPPFDDDVPPVKRAQAQSKTPRPENLEAKPQHAAASSEAEQQPESAQPEASGEEHEKQVPWIPTEAGLQRMSWDLKADGPVRWTSAPDFNQGPKAGALVPPGEYKATLTVGGQTVSEKFQVVEDPASKGNLAGIKARYQVEEAALHEVSQLDTALNRLHAMQEQLEALRLAVKGSADAKSVDGEIDGLEKQMKAVESKITSNPGAEEGTLRVPDQIHEHLLGLASGLQGEDDPPSAAVLDEQQALQPGYVAALDDFNKLVRDHAVAFNISMANRKLPGVVAGKALAP
jgi:photosystem II stability/assembly factor-like uncharacterized protein